MHAPPCCSNGELVFRRLPQYAARGRLSNLRGRAPPSSAANAVCSAPRAHVAAALAHREQRVDETPRARTVVAHRVHFVDGVAKTDTGIGIRETNRAADAVMAERAWV